jgi:hypothetical protein
MRDCTKRMKDLREPANLCQKTPSSNDSNLYKQFADFITEFQKQKSQNGADHNASGAIEKYQHQ